MKDHHDDTPQRDRPLEWSAGERRIGRKPKGPQVWPSSSRSTSEPKYRGIATDQRRIGRPVEPEVVGHQAGQDPTTPESRVERSRPRGRRRRRASR